MAKKKTSIDEKFERQDFDLWAALDAIDRKDYGYYDTLTAEQQKKFAPYMVLMYMSTVSNQYIQKEYILKTNKIANLHFFNDNIKKHPKLQWMMLCASSPLKGKQYHKWIPHIRDALSKLRENIKGDEIKEYYKKLYPKATLDLIDEITKEHTKQHQTKMYIGQQFSNMKFDEIEVLLKFITDKDIETHKKESGN